MMKVYKYALLSLIAIASIALNPAVGQCAEEGSMDVSPKVLVLDYNGNYVTVHTEIAYWSVDLSTLQLYGEGMEPVEPCGTKSDLRGNLVVKFRFEDVREIVVSPSTELVMTGNYLDGAGFTLTGSIDVKN